MGNTIQVASSASSADSSCCASKEEQAKVCQSLIDQLTTIAAQNNNP